MPIATVNPATGEVVVEFDELTAADVDARVEAAADAWHGFRTTSFDERARWLVAAGDILDDEVDDIARTMTLEMGKTFAASKAEVQKCAKVCRFYAQHGASFLADETVDPADVGAAVAYGRYQPLGPVLAVMPWNFPLWQVMRFAAPALMAGNVGLLKHASNVPQTALFIEDLFRRAGFPHATFQTLLIGSDLVERVLRSPHVRAATLTGSSAAGQAVAAIAGDVLKPMVLELGGSDPFVVMPSADLPEAARVAAVARCQNNGQSCIAAKRFIVHSEVATEFERLFVEQLESLTVGHPLDEATDVGPLATEGGRKDVEELVADALEKGATLLTGGKPVEGAGWYYPPTAVAGITSEMRMYHEEVFGPVAALYEVADIEEAIALSNATELGLGSNIWTNDEAEAERFIADSEAGAVFVNGMTTSYPELPFGGVKGSGYGRELAAQGIRSFCNLKTVWVGQGSGEASTARSE